MEEHPLLRKVANWTGRAPTQHAFEALGFSMHKVWQNRVIQFCGEQQSRLLNQYWDETAIETMQSLGQSYPDLRAFLIQPKYRSAFLDELFANRDFVEPLFLYPPLIRCLSERAKKLYRDEEFRQSEATLLNELQMAESERLGIQTTGWSGKKRDAIPFVNERCECRGFRPFRKRWRKTVNGGLVFEVGVNLGGDPFCGKLPLVFRIFDESEPGYVFDFAGAAMLNRLLPGFQVYERCNEASEYVLAIRAYIELFDVIANSFGLP